MVHSDNPTMRRIGLWMSSGGTSAEYWGNKFLEVQKRQRCEGVFFASCLMSDFQWPASHVCKGLVALTKVPEGPGKSCLTHV